MPNPSFVIDGTLYDTDKATVMANIKVFAVNYTKGTETSVSTDPNGKFIIDLGQLSTSWSNNDIIIIYATAIGKNACIIAQILTTDAVWAIGSLYMKPGSEIYNTDVYIKSILFTSATAKTLWIFERNNRSSSAFVSPRIALDVGANATASHHFAKTGIHLKDGCFIIVGTQSNTNDPGKLTAGVANAIGDTTTGLYYPIIEYW